MIILRQNMAQDCPTQKSQDSLSLELLCNTIVFAASSQANMYSYIHRINPITQSIYIKQLEQSS